MCKFEIVHEFDDILDEMELEQEQHRREVEAFFSRPQQLSRLKRVFVDKVDFDIHKDK